MQNFWDAKTILKDKFNLIQINIGDVCNLTCHHCHIGASPIGTKNMSKETTTKIIEKIKSMNIDTIEFTGGTPEMNPNFQMFLEQLGQTNKNMVVRTSLTILENKKYTHFINLYKKYNVKIIASLPSVFEDQTTTQRGEGVYDSTIALLKTLNNLGYGDKNSSLKLDLVYNPVGVYLPSPQQQLENEYKDILKKRFNIQFNSLATIVNMPIKRFKTDLKKQNLLDKYMGTLKSNFNKNTLDNIMCKNLITIDYRGFIYDCDFNLALEIPIKGYENIPFWDINFDNFQPSISFNSHCYACTVNSGSSCMGEVISNSFDETLNAQEYYGDILSSSADLKTTACCTLDMIPQRVKDTLPYIMDEIKDKYYGCGSPIPLDLENQTILDLGCGSGRDVYILSKLTGEDGFVYGIDMTKNQINIAKKFQTAQTKRFEYKKINTSFIHDYIETIDKHFKPNSLDIVTSNCVINLLKDKKDILKKIYKLLKNGGEFYFSDVYATRRLSKHIKEHKVLHGECLGGALYTNDFTRYAMEAGFIDPRIVSSKEIKITDKKLKEIVGEVKFYSITYRLWKLNDLDTVCEDYGQFAIYKGGQAQSHTTFELDINHIFELNRPERVCKNTASMLSDTRFNKYFKIIGDTAQHFGEFAGCATLSAQELNNKSEIGVISCDC